MQWRNPLGETIFNRSYAMKDDAGNVIETFEQACKRIAKFAATNSGQAKHLEKLLLDQKIIPGGRWWYGAGRDYPQINNCFVIPLEHGNIGKFSHDLCITLMTGGGVGVNYSAVEAQKPRSQTVLPTYPEIYISESHPDYRMLVEKYGHFIRTNPIENGEEIRVGYPVKDSREGWGVAVMKIANAVINCQEAVLNISDIRPRGTAIKGFGGISAGPDALMIMIDGIFNAIMRCYLKGKTLGPIDWMRIANFIARGVSSSGLRRSAMMGMLHWEHESINNFITCKDNDGELEIMNVSVVIDNTFVKQASNKGTKANKLYDKIMKHACTHGEPGLWNIEEARKTVPEAIATNPCGEQSLPPYGNCNLGHLNLAAHKTKEELASSAKALTEMLINGTLKAKFPLPEFYARVDKDRRIGLGILGLHTWLVQRGKPFALDAEDTKLFEDLFKTIRTHANVYAKKLRINKPETVTTVAPTGTIAFMAGVTSGIEPMFCAAYKRRYYSGGINQKLEEKVIVDPLAKECLEKGIKVDDSFTLTTDQHIDVQLKIQDAFVDNSVSKTINLPSVGTFDVEEVKKSVLKNLEKGLKGITVYPNGARGNQPFTPMPLEEAMKDSTETSSTETKCSTGVCEL